MAYTAIIGASGYSGQETIDRVLAHPELDLFALGSDSLAGQPASALDPRLARNGARRAPAFVTNEEALASDADLVFVCLDHERAAAIDAPARGVVVDLSGAHRLQDAGLYDEWYGFAHPRPNELERWSYSIPELAPPGGRLISNPGCFAVAALLALQPLAEIVDPRSVVIDGKTGISGAGKALRPSSHASTVLENVSAYRVGGHQHEPEIAQALGFPVCFVPHLIPIRRGLIVTCYLEADAAEARARLEACYVTAPAVTVLPEGVTPELARVQGTDAAEIAVFEDRATGKTIVIAAIDNLGKGAAGQAVQNANVALGYSESAGLRLSGVLV